MTEIQRINYRWLILARMLILFSGRPGLFHTEPGERSICNWYDHCRHTLSKINYKIDGIHLEPSAALTWRRLWSIPGVKRLALIDMRDSERREDPDEVWSVIRLDFVDQLTTLWGMFQTFFTLCKRNASLMDSKVHHTNSTPLKHKFNDAISLNKWIHR